MGTQIDTQTETQTDRETDMAENITYPHTWVVMILSAINFDHLRQAIIKYSYICPLCMCNMIID